MNQAKTIVIMWMLLFLSMAILGCGEDDLKTHRIVWHEIYLSNKTVCSTISDRETCETLPHREKGPQNLEDFMSRNVMIERIDELQKTYDDNPDVDVEIQIESRLLE